MPVVAQWMPMIIEFIRERQREVLHQAMIGRRDNQETARTQRLTGAPKQIPGKQEMLDHLDGNDGIETVMQIFRQWRFEVGPDELAFPILPGGDGQAAERFVDSCHLETARSESMSERAIAAAQIEDRFDAFRCEPSGKGRQDVCVSVGQSLLFPFELLRLEAKFRIS